MNSDPGTQRHRRATWLVVAILLALLAIWSWSMSRSAAETWRASTWAAALNPDWEKAKEGAEIRMTGFFVLACVSGLAAIVTFSFRVAFPPSHRASEEDRP